MRDTNGELGFGRVSTDERFRDRGLSLDTRLVPLWPGLALSLGGALRAEHADPGVEGLLPAGAGPGEVALGLERGATTPCSTTRSTTAAASLARAVLPPTMAVVTTAGYAAATAASGPSATMPAFEALASN